jgi:hypothetical protein
MELKSEKEVNGILNSIKRILKSGDISKLTKSAYNFLYLSSGFIAHYNRYGFMDYYSGDDCHKFVHDILQNQRYNQWNNFHPGERDYYYMMQKKEIYNKIVQIALTVE